MQREARIGPSLPFLRSAVVTLRASRESSGCGVSWGWYDTPIRLKLRSTFDREAMDANPAARAPLRVAVTGASGLVGTELVRCLEGDGHTVVRLVRREPKSAAEIRWYPEAGRVDAAALEG